MGHVPTHGPRCTKVRSFLTGCKHCYARVVYFECSCGSKVLFDPPHGGVHDCRGGNKYQPSGLITWLGASNNCRCCGRPLTHPVSRQLGVGPVCARRLGVWMPMADALPLAPAQAAEKAAIAADRVDAEDVAPKHFANFLERAAARDVVAKRFANFFVGRFAERADAEDERTTIVAKRAARDLKSITCYFCGKHRPFAENNWVPRCGPLWQMDGYYCSSICERLDYQRRWG